MRIGYRETESEFEAQAWIYWKLRERGFDVRGEVKVEGDLRDSRGCRLDLVIYIDKVAVRVIEVKSERRMTRCNKRPRKYAKLDYPLDLVYGDEKEQYLDWLLSGNVGRWTQWKGIERPRAEAVVG